MALQSSSDAPEVVPATQHVPHHSKWSNFETVFTNAKAGMSGVNKEHVKRIVYEMSKVRRHNGYCIHLCSAYTPTQLVSKKVQLALHQAPLFQVLKSVVMLICRILHTSRMSKESKHRQNSASSS